MGLSHATEARSRPAVVTPQAKETAQSLLDTGAPADFGADGAPIFRIRPFLEGGDLTPAELFEHQRMIRSFAEEDPAQPRVPLPELAGMD